MRVLPILVLLAACSGNPANEQAAAADRTKAEAAIDAKAVHAGFAPPAPAPLKTDSLEPVTTKVPGTALPPGDLKYRYLGRWATTPRLCAAASWRFQSRDLVAADGQKCTYPLVAGVPTGYELQGECRPGGRKVMQTIRLSFDEPRHVMRVEGATIGPVDLIYCGG